MRQSLIILKRELKSYSLTSATYIYIAVFLATSGISCFYFGSLFERNIANLNPLFDITPWLYLLLIPAIATSTWAEERKSGSIEFLLTLPINSFQVVMGKFLAAWTILGLSLLLTFPLATTINYLGQPDNTALYIGYLGSWLLAGAYLSIGCCLSALARDHLTAFISTFIIGLVFMTPNLLPALDVPVASLPEWLSASFDSIGLISHFDRFSKGVIDLRDLLYFFAMISAWLIATTAVIELKKAE